MEARFDFSERFRLDGQRQVTISPLQMSLNLIQQIDAFCMKMKCHWSCSANVSS